MQYRREVDGLRAVACLSVILYHANFKLFGGGFVGVDVFFVISGYLITGIILVDQEAGRFSLGRFYERRIRRILPALFFVMAVSILVAWFWLLPQDLDDFAQSIVAVGLYLSNVYYWLGSGYFDIASELKPLLHTWSLAVEEQYYLVFPLLLMAVRRWQPASKLMLFTAIGLASLVLAHWSAPLYRGAAFFLLPTRAWEFLMGAMVVVHEQARPDRTARPLVQNVAAALGLALVLYGVFSFDSKTPHPSLYTLAPAGGVALLLLFASEQTFVGRLLSSRVLVGLGLISYSTYLWHWPLFVFARHRSLNEPSTWSFAALSCLALALGYLSWRFVERPFRQPGRIGKGTIFAFSGALTCGFLAIGMAWHNEGGYRSRFSREVLALNDASSNKNPRQALCNTGGLAFRPPTEACVLGDGDHLVGVLLGDSHADALSYALSSALQASSLGVSQMTYGGCAPSETFFRAGEFLCGRYNTQVREVLSDVRYRNVIMMARWTIYLEGTGFDNGEGGVEQGVASLWVDGGVTRMDVSRDAQVRKQAIARSYRQSIQALLARGKHVFLVYPVPEVGWDVPRYAAKKLMYEQSRAVTTSYAQYQRRNATTLAVFDGLGDAPNLHRIYPTDFLCNGAFGQGRCGAVLNGVPLYYDDDHLSNAGASLLAADIVKAIVRAQP